MTGTTTPTGTPKPTHVAAATWAMTRLFASQLVTIGRLAALAALGLLVALLGLVAHFDDDPLRVGAGVIANLGLAVVVPIVTLVLASATLGEMRSEGTLVYVWLRPIPRWSIAVAATVATLAVALPVGVLPLVLAALLSGEMSLIAPVALASTLAVIGYAGLYVTLGVGVGRSFLVGLGYVLVWEGGIARVGGGFAKLSVLAYTSSVIERLADVELDGLGEQGLVAAIVVPAVVLVAGCGLTSVLLARREVD